VPSSQAPHLLWESANLVAACRRCNYGDGSRVAAQNQRETMARLQQIIGAQHAEIDRLLETVARYEDQAASRRFASRGP
jgi:5-methylcytosine-specific restriction endonuclease McrA